ncbi:bifunctional 2-polyprenyl-6-hydroxyphenol methylase/3-demethylubiquinol 3-O-methyltransferase UbiG [Microbacterium sp. SORGH_AS_0888]|uniref:class I SAM-dependent methyltransferase n=1 Tax=Microbacterium sp. SORGH_AS_0888 TaxID=3041791 RepID=UPI00278058A8|nr:class I SAM-dependent methyltransferase [Microbacterium sp. SORGH_AS_0888]MDQ1128490.1 SAM-dependent methyltransferase [Microbacterium sp. SORGH_AS_0888]
MTAQGEHVDIDARAAREANLANWNDRAELHEHAYGLEAYDDPAHLSRVVRDDLAALAPFVPSVEGLDICHLQCHIGTDTLSFVRAGARVTGVDFSPVALEAAARLADRLGLTARWVLSDALEARARVSGDFDLVYTSIGAICWLDDLERWAAQVAGLLRPGGTFYIRDGHPMLYTLDENAPGLVVRYRYLSDGTAASWDDDSTYVGDGTVAHARSYEWPHPLSEIVNALIGAGLVLMRLDEGTLLPWRFSERMVEVDGGWMWPEAERLLAPCTFTIVARKPA